MIFDRPIEQMTSLFAEQFQADGSDYLYRKVLTAAPVRVTEKERDDFVASYRRQARFSLWATLLSLLLLEAILIGISVNDDSVDVETGTYAIIGLVLVPCFWFSWQAWNAPFRALRHRGAAGAALTAQEARRIGFDRITYGQLAGVGLGGLYFVWRGWAEYDGFSGWGKAWLGVGVLMMAIAAVQAIRKWRLERS